MLLFLYSLPLDVTRSDPGPLRKQALLPPSPLRYAPSIFHLIYYCYLRTFSFSFSLPRFDVTQTRGRYSSLFSPLLSSVRAFLLIATIIQHFLPSSTRVELQLLIYYHSVLAHTMIPPPPPPLFFPPLPRAQTPHLTSKSAKVINTSTHLISPHYLSRAIHAAAPINPPALPPQRLLLAHLPHHRLD